MEKRGGTTLPYATSNLLASLKRRIPLGEEDLKVIRPFLLNTNSDMNFRSGDVTDGVSYHTSAERNRTGIKSGYLKVDVKKVFKTQVSEEQQQTEKDTSSRKLDCRRLGCSLT